jgi:hypothetical protein
VIGCAGPPCPKSGYNFSMLPGLVVQGVLTDDTSLAAPLGWNTTGTKNWCSNSDAVIRMFGPQQGAAGPQAVGLTGTACNQAPWVPAQ